MFLTGLALKSTVVLACAWMITMMLRRRSAAVRHLVWTAASAAVLILPLLSVSLPAWRVPVAATFPGPATFQVSGSARALAQPLAAKSGMPAPVSKGSEVPPIDWNLVAESVWAAGTLLALARMLLAWFAVERLRLRAKPFAAPDSCGSQAVDFLETPSGRMPMTFGILRSAILMPADASAWSEERRRVVLLHELAHVRRGDVATHLLARLALISYWWNPLAWFAWREFVKERERAADDLVLNAGTPATEYARHLLEVARSMQLAPATGWAAVAMVRRSQLETRLRSILASGVNRTSAGRASVLLTAFLAVLLIAPLAAIRAQNATAAAMPADLEGTLRAARSQKNYEMLENAATAAVEARQYEAAEKLLDAAVAIRGEISGNPSPVYGLGLLKLAALQQRRHENSAAQASYAKAAEILGEDPKAAPALLYLGTSALIKKNYSQANDYFQHVQRLDAGSAGMAQMWSAVVMEAQHNNEEADALFRRAVAQQDPKSHEASVILQVYSNFLTAQGRTEEAAELDARAKTLQQANSTPPKSSELPSGAYKIGGDVHPPSVLEKKEPEYTDEARAAKLMGTEILFVQIGPDGIAHTIQVVRGVGLGLDESGVDAVSQWRFKPGEKNGQPVSVLATIEINFRLL